MVGRSLQREETERGGIQAVNFATVTADAVVMTSVNRHDDGVAAVMTLVTVTMTESPS